MSDPLATVIIPNYNGLRYLPRLMETLHAQSDQRFRITVVDDRSPGRDVDYLHSQWPDVHVIRNPHNLGFAGSCNAGMRLADTPLVVLLNNDTHVDVNWFAEGVRPFDDPRVAAVASLVVLAEPPHPIDTAGDIYSIAGGAVKRNHLLPCETANALPERIFSPSGASAFYRRSAVAEAGYLDPRFESYYEDVDLGFRLAWAGHHCAFAPRSICYHHLSSSYSPKGWKYHFNSARNAEIVWWSHMSPALRRRHWRSHLLFLALQGLAEVRRGRGVCFMAGKWQVLRHVRHIRDKRRADAAMARATDEQIDALMVQDWWGLHVGPRIKMLLGWMRRA
jgi:GT2 family glycosyltransferase